MQLSVFTVSGADLIPTEIYSAPANQVPAPKSIYSAMLLHAQWNSTDFFKGR